MSTESLIPCACGCGQMLTPFDKRGRPRQFLPSHWSKLQQPAHAVICEQCGASFRRQPNHYKKVRHHFCNQTCAGQWAQEHGTQKGENNGHYNTVTVPCAGCQTPVSKAYSLVMRRNKRVYCDTCIPLYARRGRKGYYVGYPKAFSADLRYRIRKRDNFTCQECHATQETAGTLHVHHIDYTKTNNDPINLIALCVTCHGKTNWAMPMWQAHFTAMMQQRFPTP